MSAGTASQSDTRSELSWRYPPPAEPASPVYVPPACGVDSQRPSRRSKNSLEITTASTAPPPPAGAIATQSRTVVMPSADIKILGERFVVELEDGSVFIRHPRWSLLGYGASLKEAQAALREDALSVAEIWRTIPPEKMDAEALRLRDFLVLYLGRLWR
jgi:hypothetical protein